MKLKKLHNWNLAISQAIKLQSCLAAKVLHPKTLKPPKIIAGVDCGLNLKNNTIHGAVVLFRFPSLEQIEIKTSRAKLTFPYIPGLLSFRELPVLLQTFRKLKNKPDLVIVDGQGISHPRRLGIASHLGLWLNIPTIGCAKSILIGKYDKLGKNAGSWTYLKDKDEIIGAVIRTKDNCKPVIISEGHKTNLEFAKKIVLRCCDNYRIPKPTRVADKLIKNPRYR